jgi:hypothetical protein
MTPLVLHAFPWSVFGIALLVWGFAPGALLRLIVLAYRRDHPRRRELLGELHAVPRIERPFWVVEQLESALFEGLLARLRAHGSRSASDKKQDSPAPDHDADVVIHSDGERLSYQVKTSTFGDGSNLEMGLTQMTTMTRGRLGSGLFSARRGRPGSSDHSFSDGSGEVCVSCGGPHFDCSDPANWDDK